MGIKEAVEIVRKTWKQKGLRPEEYHAHKVIMDALCSGYTLCKVDETTEKINEVRDSILNNRGSYEPNDVLDIIDNILDFLNEACL